MRMYRLPHVNRVNQINPAAAGSISQHRGAVVGKTGKTSVLPWFWGIERVGGSRAAPPSCTVVSNGPNPPENKITWCDFTSSFKEISADSHNFRFRILHALYIKRSIFQTFWRLHCCPDFLFIELDTSNFGYLLIFWFCWAVQSLRKIGQHLY